MEIPEKLVQEWEKWFPDLDSTWTHWWLEGDGSFIALIPSTDLSEALNIVKKNHKRFRSIMAYRARLDENGAPIRQEKYRHEVSNDRNNQIWLKRWKRRADGK